MPIFIAALGGMLINIAASLVGRVIVALGMSVITYIGVKSSLDYLLSQAVSSLLSLPSEVVDVLAIMRVGQCISIVTSAYVIRLTLNGLDSDTLKRWAYN